MRARNLRRRTADQVVGGQQGRKRLQRLRQRRADEERHMKREFPSIDARIAREIANIRVSGQLNDAERALALISPYARALGKRTLSVQDRLRILQELKGLADRARIEINTHPGIRGADLGKTSQELNLPYRRTLLKSPRRPPISRQ